MDKRKPMNFERIILGIVFSIVGIFCWFEKDAFKEWSTAASTSEKRED
jgi:cadmium resistance protein CadD (predicted permease)